VYRRTAAAFVRGPELTAEQNDRLATPLLPDFSVAFTEIFAPPL
jgi:hypothetical protein